MILVDTSAWIDFLNDADTPSSETVARALRVERIVVGDLILVEVLQGIREERKVQETAAVLKRHQQQALCGPAIAEAAASNYRRLRRQGVTIRGTIDVVVATWCIENDAEIIHNDRDLAAMERLLGLRAFA